MAFPKLRAEVEIRVPCVRVSLELSPPLRGRQKVRVFAHVMQRSVPTMFSELSSFRGYFRNDCTLALIP